MTVEVVELRQHKRPLLTHAHDREGERIVRGMCLTLLTLRCGWRLLLLLLLLLLLGEAICFPRALKDGLWL